MPLKNIAPTSSSMMKADSEKVKELLLGISQGDQKAFDMLFKMLYKRLLNFGCQYLKNREIAEEIVLDVFIKLWDQRADITKVQSAEAYLFISVKNASINYLERISMLNVCDFAQKNRNELVDTNNPLKYLEWKELLFKMDEAVSTLPGECQRIFRLSKEDGLKAREVAEMLNISRRTVETQLYRAVRKIDLSLSGYLERTSKGKQFR